MDLLFHQQQQLSILLPSKLGRLEMKPHEPKKQNESEKGGRKQRVIKTKSKKKKNNKTLSQKTKRGQKKLDKKTIKRRNRRSRF
jgi:hypothetical protein